MKKITSKKNTVGCIYSPTLHLEFEKVTDLSGVELGDTVRVVVMGKVKSVEQREDYEDPKQTHAALCIRDFTATIVKNTSQFDELLDDNDEDD